MHFKTRVNARHNFYNQILENSKCVDKALDKVRDFNDVDGGVLNTLIVYDHIERNYKFIDPTKATKLL